MAVARYKIRTFDAHDEPVLAPVGGIAQPLAMDIREPVIHPPRSTDREKGRKMARGVKLKRKRLTAFLVLW